MIRTYSLCHGDKEYISPQVMSAGIDVTAAVLAATAYVRCLSDLHMPTTARQREDAREWATLALERLRDVSLMCASEVAIAEGICLDEVATAVDFASGLVLFCDGADADALEDNLCGKDKIVTAALDTEIKRARGDGATPPADLCAAEETELESVEAEIDELEIAIDEMTEDGSLSRRSAIKDTDMGERLRALIDRRVALHRTIVTKRRTWAAEHYYMEVRSDDSRDQCSDS